MHRDLPRMGAPIKASAALLPTTRSRGLFPGMFEPVALEVLPAGSIVMTVNAIYDPKNWPMIFAVFINNNGADAVDLSGWIVRESDGDSFQFPDGTILEPGSTATISQTDPTDKPCPGDIGSVFYMCNAFGSDTVSQETQVWHGGTLTLIDADGLNVASWDS